MNLIAKRHAQAAMDSYSAAVENGNLKIAVQ